MIQIGNKKYAKNNSEFTDSSFKSGGTCDGFYKVYKNRIIFKDMQDKPFACLVANENQSQYFVKCSKLENGKMFYMYGIDNDSLNKLGIIAEDDNKLRQLDYDYASYIWKYRHD